MGCRPRRVPGGNFPPGWNEWNDRYRDSVRAYWKGDGGLIGEFAAALHRLRRPVRGQRPQASCQHQLRHRHDGFTLNDLVSYNQKHNSANGEDNRDGSEDNRSWNCGVEGPTDDPAIRELRERQKRNCSRRCCSPRACRCCSAGDELGRTQGGNNNAYCQDNQIPGVRLEPGRSERSPWPSSPGDRAYGAVTPSSRRRHTS